MKIFLARNNQISSLESIQKKSYFKKHTLINVSVFQIIIEGENAFYLVTRTVNQLLNFFDQSDIIRTPLMSYTYVWRHLRTNLKWCWGMSFEIHKCLFSYLKSLWNYLADKQTKKWTDKMDATPSFGITMISEVPSNPELTLEK